MVMEGERAANAHRQAVQPEKIRSRSRSRRILLSLMFAAIIPVLLFGGAASYLTAQASRERVREAALEKLDRLAERVTGELASEVHVARMVATLPSLERDDLSTFYTEASRVVKERPLWETVSLASPSGEQRLDLLRPLGDSLSPVDDRIVLDRVVQTQRPVIGGIGAPDAMSEKRFVAMGVPVVRDDGIAYVLTVGMSPRAIQEVLIGADIPTGWVGAIADAQGRIVARTVHLNDTGRLASEALRAAVKRGTNGFYSGRTLEGVEVETVYRDLPMTDGWSVHFGVPSETLNGPVYHSMQLFAAASLASLLLAGALAHLIGRDLAQRRAQEQESADLALALSQEREALAVEAAELGTWRWDAKADELSGSGQAHKVLGFPGASTGRGATWPLAHCLARVHEADRQRVEEFLIGGLQQGTPLDVEFRVAGAGGGTRWVRAKGRILREPGESDEDAHVMHGVLSDIEPQKRAEAERLELLQRLSAAQEAEQRRIALELHDQVGQTVTGLLLGLNALDEMLNDVGNQPARIHVRWLESVASDIGRDIHRAAADLRPTALDDLGLERALVASARDWSDRSTVGVDVQCLGLENRLPTEIETAIYRVVQEALTNVFRHAQARTASVIVERRGSRVSAIVEDDGIGFAIETVEPGQGRSDPVSRARLGLTGIRERLALLGGTLTIESAPGEGTTLFAEIPLPERR